MTKPRKCDLLPSLLLFPLTVWSLQGADTAEADRLYESGQYMRAADVLSSAIQSAPQDAALRLWLGKCYLKLKKWDDAVRELESAVRLEPGRSDHHLWLGRAYGEKASRALFFTAPGWAKKLRREFETAVKLAPDNLDARFDLLEFYLQAPGIIGGGKDKAEAEVREIAGINPRIGHAARARFYEDAKKWDLARQELEKSVREFPLQSEPYLDLADFLFRRNDYPAAESNARAALERNNKLAAAKLILAASVIRQLKNLPEAESSLREMTAGPLRDGEPSFADAHFWVGEACLAQGKRAEARQAFESALRFDPEHSKAKAALGKLK